MRQSWKDPGNFPGKCTNFEQDSEGETPHKANQDPTQSATSCEGLSSKWIRSSIFI